MVDLSQTGGVDTISCKTILNVRNLCTYFYTRQGVVKAVNGVSFDVKPGRTLAIVGESGSGKTVTALSLFGLIDPPGKIVSGEIYLDGRNLLDLSREELRRLRGKDMALVFQDPMTSLNPVFTIGTQITETLICHMGIAGAEAKIKAIEMLKRVGLPHPEKIIKRYPFQLSGGQRQRVMIALALSMNPRVLIADEPTTALDVTVQAQILYEMRQLIKDCRAGVILITHDLGVVAELADEVAVMYAGSIVEYGDVYEIFDNPLHPYTRALLKSIPRLGTGDEVLRPVRGQPPSLIDLPGRCAFLPRCEHGAGRCRAGVPPLEEIIPGHAVACHRVIAAKPEVVTLRELA